MKYFSGSILSVILIGVLHFQLYAQSTENTSQNGYLTFEIDLDRFYVIIDDNIADHRLIQKSDTLELPPGLHIVKIIWEDIDDTEFDVMIVPGKTTSHEVIIYSTFSPQSSHQFLKNNHNLIINTDPESEIYIDGKPYGREFSEALLNAGEHTIELKHPEKGSIKKEINIDPFEIQNFSRYNLNPNPVPTSLHFIPGYAQFSSKRYINSALAVGLVGTFTALTFKSSLGYSKSKKDFNSAQQNYLNAQTSAEALKYRYQSEDLIKEMDNQQNLRLIYAGGALISYLYFTYDSFKKPKGGYSKAPDNSLDFGFESPMFSSNIPVLKFTHRF